MKKFVKCSLSPCWVVIVYMRANYIDSVLSSCIEVSHCYDIHNKNYMFLAAVIQGIRIDLSEMCADRLYFSTHIEISALHVLQIAICESFSDMLKYVHTADYVGTYGKLF